MEFIECKLSELGEIVGGGTPSTKNASNYGGKISWITPKDLTNVNTRYINQGERNITEEGFKSSSTKILPINSVLFSSRAPIGYIAINNNKEVCTNQGFKSIIPNEKINYMFLYYLLKFNKNKIESMGSGTTFKEVSGTVMKNIKVNIPKNVKDQMKIAKVLSNLDDKIELNTQTNDNLSEIIERMFINFLEKHNEELITLEDAVKKIGTGADAIQRAPIVEYDTGIRCIRVGDMTNLRNRYEWGFTEMTDKDFDNYKLDIGDIVITRTAVNGLSYMIEDEMKVVCNNGLIRMKVNEKYNPMFIFLYLKTKNFYSYVHRIDGETSVRPNMKVNYFTSYKIMKIAREEQDKICSKLLPLRNKQKQIIEENNTLTQLRDTLLPKLMNGEIDLDKIKI